VALQQNSDCLSSRTENQFAFDGFFGDQPHGPTRSALWRLATNHGDDALLLGIVENLFRTRALFIVKGGIQAVAVVAVRDFANRLRSQREGLRDPRGRQPLTQLTQRERPQEDARLLDAMFYQLSDGLRVFWLDFDRDRAACHVSIIVQNISEVKCFIELIQAV
jgi:hypothetical protein